ncbi:3-isopropylmalate dehydrogenase [Spirosoma sp. KCTC 42546]|uniref:3-isopropylmalate dehydrogenase n=1 Tax=Spirosoma sp. KCTC 42546 TaxID=2520506 RepID=UPI001159D734|nr:3-isopropylmalate dehydrogenase [Spirosoma sp. KCTC 42546]QDK83434.1 3-isopropylmalate dehydrogenase [Spirosoma sp. KCTC 42546]
MAKKHIIIAPGDGIGQEVTAVGKQVVEKVAATFGHEFTYDEVLIGHVAIEAFGTPLTDESLEKMRESDAVLFGAVGDPRYDNDPTAAMRPEQGLFKMRKELGLYANIRPIKLFDELLDASSIKADVLKGADILFFRELTGDVYFGEKGRRNNGDTAFDMAEYSRYEVERIARKAFEAARTRRKKLCSVDKANVMETGRLWREVVQKMALDYPDVEVEHQYADATAMLLIKAPRRFDVVVTANLFGDILTDEASQIAGSMGMLASASIGDGTGVYEPIHGSAPDIMGKGIANPIASVLSAALMFDISFGMKAESDAIIQAVDKLLKDGFRTRDIADTATPDAKILSTEAIGVQLLKNI